MFLEVKDLRVKIDGQEIVSGLNLSVKRGEIHAIMGPNGAGKSTLAKVIGGHPAYEVIGGEILFEGKDLVELEPEERAHLGIFVSFQYPLEIPGVSNLEFLRAACDAQRKAKGETALSDEDFRQLVAEKMEMMEMRAEFASRAVNEGFSGGEKKKNEIVQMAVLEPALAILDETDSGLDIDALRIVARGVKGLMREDKAVILITHYQRLLSEVTPDFIHVMMDGRIVRSGGPELAAELERRGYDWLVEREEALCP
jgi:Fe-S cluster assembly ATP-binding protein